MGRQPWFCCKRRARPVMKPAAAKACVVLAGERLVNVVKIRKGK